MGLNFVTRLRRNPASAPVTDSLTTSLTSSTDDTITPEDISAGMQFEAQTWERLLWATGGALELSKCFYYILFYDFKKNGTPFLLAPHQMPGTSIHITSGDDPTPRLIDQKD